MIPSHSNIIVAGDFNYPDIDWQRKTTQAQSTTRRLHDEFIELVDDFTLTHVNSPTRLNRILDLVLTNAPGNCSSCTVIPGISDHEAIHAMFEFQAVRHKEPARKIPLYNKADWEGYHKHMPSTRVKLASGVKLASWQAYLFRCHSTAKFSFYIYRSLSKR